METIFKYSKLRVPAYAVNYLEYGEDDSLSEEDKKVIDDYMRVYYEIAQECGGHVILAMESDESYFTWSPDIGSFGGMVYDYTILIAV